MRYPHKPHRPDHMLRGVEIVLYTIGMSLLIVIILGLIIQTIFGK